MNFAEIGGKTDFEPLIRSLATEKCNMHFIATAQTQLPNVKSGSVESWKNALCVWSVRGCGCGCTYW